MERPLIRRCCAMVLLVVGTAECLAHECGSEQREDQSDEYAVYDGTGRYIGYVSREQDGTWFVWRDSQGTTNKTYQHKEDAINVVCHWDDGSEDESRHPLPVVLAIAAGGRTPATVASRRGERSAAHGQGLSTLCTPRIFIMGDQHGGQSVDNPTTALRHGPTGSPCSISSGGSVFVSPRGSSDVV